VCGSEDVRFDAEADNARHRSSAMAAVEEREGGSLVERLADGFPTPLPEEEAYRLAKFALREIADDPMCPPEYATYLRREAER